MICPADWRPVGVPGLEPNALIAATAVEQNLVVTAGPGAGKTELLAQRADFLFRTGVCLYPRRILAISFKVDAARNLRDRVRLRSGVQYAARFDSFTFHAFAKRIIDNFRPTLTGDDSLDADYRVHPKTRIAHKQITFNDLVPLALKILETNRYARGALRQTYSHVFLDEFQDATGEQYTLIKDAFEESGAVLTAVGDAKQRIMAWAGALDGILHTFAEDFSAESLSLYQNFRSAPRLRRMQNLMIMQMDPHAASPDEALKGDKGIIEVHQFDSDADEADALACQIQEWLAQGTDPNEIAILIRQQPHLFAATLRKALTTRGIPLRNEHDFQSLNAEPAAALVFNFIRVIANDRQAHAYTELMRMSARSGVAEEEGLRFDRQLKRLIQDARTQARASATQSADPEFWRTWVNKFLDLVSQPVLVALSPGYQQGTWLTEVVNQTLDEFSRALLTEGDPTTALKQFSDTDAVRLLTIHKCKGLEFDKVIVLGIEEEMFRNDSKESMSEFFVATSRAKTHLILTLAKYRQQPQGHTGWWKPHRRAQKHFIGFALSALT